MPCVYYLLLYIYFILPCIFYFLLTLYIYLPGPCFGIVCICLQTLLCNEARYCYFYTYLSCTVISATYLQYLLGWVLWGAGDFSLPVQFSRVVRDALVSMVAASIAVCFPLGGPLPFSRFLGASFLFACFLPGGGPAAGWGVCAGCVGFSNIFKRLG